MKNKHFIAGIAMSYFLLLATAFSVNAQQPNVSLSDQMDYIIAPLDFTEVTSGLLLDRGFKMMNVEDFDGTTTADTLTQYGDWFRQYGTMVTSKVTPTSPLGTTGDWKPHADSLLQTGVVPIMVLHANYHKFLEDSVLLTSLITEQNGQLYDVPNRPTSPYTAHEIFSFCTKKTSVNDSLSQNFRIEPDFFRSNTGKTVGSISIDFDNGAGYQSMSYNVNKKITWSSPGKKYLTLKITYTDNSTYYAKTLYEIINKTGGQRKYYGAPDQEFHVDHPTIANHGATITIEYGCGNTELRKPFIYVEGFNPDQFGNMHYEDGFFDDFSNYQFNWSEGFPMLDALDENGYDVVYIDFDRGAGDLKENAQTVREVIKQINAQKAANNSTSPNILVGYSMGGVVARLALTYMEHANETHEVSYYVSVDSPHLGANVPRGVIAALIDIRNYEYAGFNVSEDVPTVEDAYQVLFSPAARQMLIYSGEGSNTLVTGSGPTHIAFKNHLDEQAMPTQTLQNIAVSKGNGSGIGQGYGSLTPFFNLNTNTFNAGGCFSNIPDAAGWLAGAVAWTALGVYAKVYIDINSMAGYSSQSFHIYDRKIRIIAGGLIFFWLWEWDRHETKAQYVRYYDGVQGGTYGISSFSGLGNNQFITGLANGSYQPCAKLHQTEFCFIPTVSALNIKSLLNTPSYQIDTEQIVANGDTPFNKAYVVDPSKYPVGYTAPNNESHLDLTPSNVFPFSQVIPTDFNAVNENPTIHGYTFNFGYAKVGNVITETTDRITRPLTVSGLSSANGAIWVNRNARLENINDTNNPVSTSENYSVELTRSCDYNYGRITIEEFGSIIIGEDHQKNASMVVRNNSWIKMNNGFIEVRDGSKLVIDAGAELRLNGGLLRIQDGGEVIIKAGGKLIYEKDAQIELNGNDAVLSLGGLTHIGNDATFTFTYQGSKSGYIRMLKEGFSEQRFSAGVNAKVELNGKNKDDLILYIEEAADFWEFDGDVEGEAYTSQKFVEVTFKDGKIIMEDHARIVLLSKSRFQRTTVESLNPGHKPRGITPLTFCHISSSTFNHMPINALLHYWESGSVLLETSTLNHSYINVRGYGYKVRSSVFNFSSIHSESSTIANSISNSVFLYAFATAVTDRSPTELFIYKTEFRENKRGIWKRNGRVTAKCSDFTNNKIAILGGEGSEVNISTLFNGGYNHFAQNDYNIQLFQAFRLQMEDGYNELYRANIMNIEGTLDINTKPCPSFIQAKNNIWTPFAAEPTVDPNHPNSAKFDVSIIENYGMPWANLICQIPFKFGPVAPITPCGKFDDPRDPGDPVYTPKSNTAQSEFPVINTPVYFTDTPFNIAMKVAAYNTTVADTVNGNDLIAADMYYELLYLAELDSNITDSMAVVLEKMRWSGLNNYKATIERLFADSVLSRTDNQTSFEPTIENYVDVLMHFTDSIKTDKNYKQQFQLEIWKSSLLSTIGKKQQALHILSNINYCDHDSIQRIILLEHIQSLEFDLHRSQLDIHTFLTDSVTFVVDSSIYEIPLESYISTTGFGSYIMSPNSILFSACNTATKPSSYGLYNGNIEVVLYPNPAQNYLNISFLKGNLNSESILTLRMFELTGKEIFNTKLLSQNVKIDLPDLANALYIYRLEMNNQIINQGKISIME